MMNLRLLLLVCLAFALVCASACGSTKHGQHETYSGSTYSEASPVHTTSTGQVGSQRSYAEEAAPAADVAASAPAPSSPGAAGPAPRKSAAERHSVTLASTNTADANQAQASIPQAEEQELSADRGQLLIYTAGLVLAIYEVEETQEKAVALVEEMGGYISRRTSNQLTARVPAAKFRDALEALAAIGDTLDQSWQAQDVTDEVRDLDIRLANALGLRDRLEALLQRANTVEDALKIEAELERITLEIERIRGQLKSFDDRIAYSTIEISFRPKSTESVPKNDFLLPFQWLNALGLKSLLRAPSLYR